MPSAHAKAKLGLPMRHALPLLIALAAGSAALAAPRDPPSAATLAAQAAAARSLPADTRDEAFAARGFIATRADPLIKDAAGRTVWDLGALDALAGPAPATVNPSLWRHARLMARHGLFRVSDRIWQVRGFDLANATFVKGARGWIVIDVLGSVETARAARDLVFEKLGARPITAVIYTHPHADHFGGAAGMVDEAEVKAGRTQVIAPKGFMAAAVGENVIAGPAMQRRAAYQFGTSLERGPSGLVNDGIGPALAVGAPSLIAPTREIGPEGGDLLVDGVKLRFQFTKGTEAPVEFNIGFPDWKVVDLAENANATQHNILTPRGAVVRDAKTWADELTRALDLFGESEILITSHGWPRFGRAVIADYLAKHRDAYAYLHDQTVRLMNSGLTGDEIAARLKLPPALEAEWFDRPYYGSLSFNSRAVYQFYMGWYDANPVHLAPRPPVETGRRYVEALGGAARMLTLAQAAYDGGDYAWAAELLNHAVFADPKDEAARTLLARAYDQLGYQAETSLWRNIYLTGASELRNGPPSAAAPRAGGFTSALDTAQLFDLLAVRLDGAKAAAADLKLQFVFPERGETTYVTVARGVLIHRPTPAPGPVDATLTVSRADFLGALLAGQPLAAKVASGAAKVTGDSSALLRFAALMTPPAPNFPIVER